ncbi:MAG TPA: CoA-acylating methylmalonate-semialdehyde dehydrogenase [Acidimicrobiia bacterium]|nr:CoA-acylating methylmalonate-semialdehyde dehydrogenase [Acidimicrobiia bacterium]
MVRIAHWVGGEFWPGEGSRTAPVFDPSTGEETARVSLASAEDVDSVVSVALAASADWSVTSVTRRQRVMFDFRQLLVDRLYDVAKLITAEHGKTIDDALGEVQRGLEVVEFACGIPQLLKGDFSEQVSTGVDTLSFRQPLGVVAGITPFNFPAMVPMWMFPMAIACGNTFVLKPSEKDPSASLLLAELFHEAGLPAGVFNVVQGDRDAVEALLTSRDVAAVSFVGSTPVARHVYETATHSGKRVQALGGAKNHMVVLPDADIDLAADAVVSAAYGSAGERCMAISVVVAIGSAADRLIPEVRKRIAGLKVGPGGADGMDMGPLVTSEHRNRVMGYIETGIAEGASLLDDGRGVRVEGHEDGFFVGPTLFDHVRPEMKVYSDEIFGPVLSVVRVETYEEAIELINLNPYGNGTAIFTNDGGAARRFQSEILVGMVGVNVPIPVPLSFYSFGGWKDSIFGDHGIYGPEGVQFYTRRKTVITRWPDPIHRGVDLGFPQAGR